MLDQNYERKISILDWGIIISALLLLLTVYLPQFIWKEEEKYRLEGRHRMSAIANAEEFYFELTGSYPLDGAHLFNMLAGVPLDGYMAAYALAQLDELAPLIATKLNPLIFMALIAVTGLLTAVPYLFRQLPSIKRLRFMKRTRADWKNPRRVAPVATAACFILVSMGCNQIPLPRDLVGLQSQRLVPKHVGVAKQARLRGRQHGPLYRTPASPDPASLAPTLSIACAQTVFPCSKVF